MMLEILRTRRMADRTVKAVRHSTLPESCVYSSLVVYASMRPRRGRRLLMSHKVSGARRWYAQITELAACVRVVPLYRVLIVQ